MLKWLKRLFSGRPIRTGPSQDVLMWLAERRGDIQGHCIIDEDQQRWGSDQSAR
jgi:hypothetical protein